jgi:hypothetical protein
LLGRGVDARGREGAVDPRALVARVEDASDADGRGRLDRRTVQAHGVGARVVRRHEEQLVGALEGTRERAWIRVVPATDADPSLSESLGPGHVADGDGDLVGGNPFEKVIDGRAVEYAGGTGDDDHDEALRRRGSRSGYRRYHCGDIVDT